jgi:DNA-binding SARP family transcriptional activator
VEFRILGTMEVLDGARRLALPSGRGRALLAILTLHAGEPVATDRLIDELWGGEPPTTATTVVHGLVSRLRKALEGSADVQILQTVEGGYRLSIDPELVDANRFKRMVDRSRGQAAAARAQTLTAALTLWHGPALADFTYEPFAQRTIATLEDSRIEAMEDQFDAELQLGRGAAVISELQEAVALHPFRERLRALLMSALYQAGRQAEALQAYREVQTLLLEELGLEPGPALRELEAAILRQDPALDLRDEPQQTSHQVSSSWLPRERRRVTVAVVDLAPSGDGTLDPEGADTEAERAARELLERHGARVERSLGDELVALFGFPVTREDDALRAVQSVLDVRTALRSRDAPTRMRAGIETGDIVVTGPGAALRDVVSGPVVAAARRLSQAAHDDDVFIGPAAQKLLRGAVIVKQAPGAAAWLVLEAVIGASSIPRVMSAPMIGREKELTRLRSEFRRAIRTGSPVRSTVIGDAGIGKSRLAQEAIASFGNGAHAITLRCTPPGDAMGFHPMRQAVVAAAGAYGWRTLHGLLGGAGESESAVDEIGDAIALRSPPATAHEMFPPMRRLIETLARDHPLVVVLDDLHWADQDVLDLVDMLEREAVGRIFLLCLARTDLFEDGASVPQDVVWLEPLSGAEVAQIVIDRGGPVASGSLPRIVNLSQGNPLFAEQLLAAIDDGEVDAVPASLVGLLTMRLDRLGPGERDVLRAASVAGLDFDIEVVKGLLPDDAEQFVERHIDALEGKQLIQRTGPRRFRFAHALIQMAAYQSMTRQDRDRLQAAYSESTDQDGSLSSLELKGNRSRSGEGEASTRLQSRGPMKTL